MILNTQKICLQHLLSVESLSNEEVLGLIKMAQVYKYHPEHSPVQKQYFVSNLFFENSTRTHRSFEIAERKLGLECLDFEASTSSVQKGETLYDTVLTMSALGVDIAVIRHQEDHYYDRLVESPHIHCALINGGDGSGQHPSQCLLDLMTIYEEFGHFQGLKVAIVGDLVHSRVAKSNMQMLKRLGAELFFAGAPEWYDPSFDQYGHYEPLDEIVEKVDVMMMLRVQKERHQGEEAYSKEDYHQAYGLTLDRAKRLQDHAIIMHPAPVNRDVEIADSLVESDQSRIIQQMSNGVFMRMAILEAVINAKEANEENREAKHENTNQKWLNEWAG
ncbi:aspartate carbamoyltransferase catalytic subunit [Aerococcus sanguinicola]|uniref:Aspartate carbamoyltransferase n=1 Tax=Aerococcus sanguinicola TaxID=119206 RepID=A0A5N1GTF3_9LACT|nr:aspartate carbamoyltransferase catalytic subunit [Aerococcus sanguinicola]